MSKKFIFVNTDGNYEETPGAYEITDFISTSAGAADAGKPILTDAGGQIDGSFIDSSDVDHGSLTGLGDDDHTQYSLVDGTRQYTGVVSYNSHPSFTLPTQIVDKKYVDDVATGHEHQDSAIDRLATPPGSPTTGDRYLVIATATGLWAGQEDDIAEWDGTQWVFYTPVTGWQLSVDDETDGIYYYGGSAWTKKFYESTTASLGCEKVGVDIRLDLLANGGLALTGSEVGVDAQDFDGEGLIANSALDLAIDWSTAFNDAKAVKAEDLNSTATGEGASIIGIEDAGGYTSVNSVEAAIQELYGLNAAVGVNYTSAGVTKGDVVYVSANNTASTMPITANHRAIGIAATTVAASGTVKVLANDTIVTNVLTGATAGTRYYWNGTGFQTALPSSSGNYVWVAGIAKNATDLHVQVEYIKKNS